MSVVLPIGIEEEENSGYELILSIAPDYILQAETDEYLIEIVAYAQALGFSRFVGATRGEKKKGIRTFFFSKPDYFDKDDMLVNDFELSHRVNLLMKNEFGI